MSFDCCGLRSFLQRSILSILEIHFLSTDSDNPVNQHPSSARQIVLHTPTTMFPPRFDMLHMKTQMSGDLVLCCWNLWKPFRDEMEICVYNWKTGVLVWVGRSVLIYSNSTLTVYSTIRTLRWCSSPFSTSTISS